MYINMYYALQKKEKVREHTGLERACNPRKGEEM